MRATITGMFPVTPGATPVSGWIEFAFDATWSDGLVRISSPVRGILHPTLFNSFVTPGTLQPLLVPATAYGSNVSAGPPITVTWYLLDSAGQPNSDGFYAGILQADASGNWSVNTKIVDTIVSGTGPTPTGLYLADIGTLVQSSSALPTDVAALAVPPDEFNKPIRNTDLELGTILYQQVFELYKNPPGIPLAGLGGGFIEPWAGFEWIAMPWIDARKFEAGEYWLTTEVNAGCSTTFPLTVRYTNVTYGQSVNQNITDPVADEYYEGGLYDLKRTTPIKLSSFTTVGRRALTRLKVSISAPAGSVALIELRLIVEWRR